MLNDLYRIGLGLVIGLVLGALLTSGAKDQKIKQLQFTAGQLGMVIQYMNTPKVAEDGVQ